MITCAFHHGQMKYAMTREPPYLNHLSSHIGTIKLYVIN